MNRLRFLDIAKVVFAIGILTWLISKNFLDVRLLRGLLQPGYFVLCLLVFGMALFVMSERFRYLLSIQGLSISAWESAKLYFIGLFFNFLGSYAGDIVKAYYLKKDLGDISRTGPYVVVLDRLVGLYVMLIIATVTIVVEFDMFMTQPDLSRLAVSVFLVTGILTLAISFLLMGAGRRFLRRIYLNKTSLLGRVYGDLINSFELASQQPRVVIMSVIAGLLAQFVAILGLWIAGMASGFYEVPIIAYFFVAPLGFIVSAIPISPSGIGVGQAAFLFFFGLYLGKQSQVGPVVATAFHFFTFLISLSGLYFYLIRKKAPNALSNRSHAV